MTPKRSHADVLRAARLLEPELQGARKLGLLCSFNLDFLRPYLVVASQEAGALLAPWFGPFAQAEQMVLDAGSPLWSSAPDALLLVLRPGDLDAELAEGVEGLAPEERAARLEAVVARIVGLVQAARRRFTGPILVASFAMDRAVLDTFDASRPDGVRHAWAEANRRLAVALAAEADAHVFDYAGVVEAFGASRWMDHRLWAMARVAVATEAQGPLAAAIVRAALGALLPAAKCLVLDLDGTLWGGVLGDDGAAALHLGDDHPGLAFKQFQRALRGYRRRGMLLAIASKNDESTVLDALRTHPEMVLRESDFAAIHANWGPKPDSLRAIAKALNIGTDALVFLDDNPVERAAVRAQLPEVRVPEWPTDPLAYVAALGEIPLLDRPRVLAEDRGRADMVAQDGGRRALQAQAESLDDFLAGLGMVATVGRCGPLTLERIHQLLHKTNQFNLTTRRHPLEEVRRLAEAGDADVLWLRLRDRFGDLGLVAVAILRAEGEVATIDTFLMSCRVMGRGVEDAMLAWIAERAGALGATTLVGEHLPTAKNTMVADFYPARGFGPAGPSEGGALYRLESAAERLIWPSHIDRAVEERR